MIQEQFEEEIEKKVSDITPQIGKEFYLPHKTIIRKDPKVLNSRLCMTPHQNQI